MTASPAPARATVGPSEEGPEAGTRLVLRAAIGLALVAAPWMAPGVAADDAERLALLVTFIWLPLTLVADAVLRDEATSSPRCRR